MANDDNIKPHQFKPGQSGNPNGRPRRLPEIRDLIDEVLGEEKDGIPAVQAIFMRWRQMASAKEQTAQTLKAAELLINYAYGKPTQKLELPPDTFPSTIRFIVEGGNDYIPRSEDDIIEPE